MAAALVGIFLAWRTTLSITVPVREAVDAAQRVADGDLSHRIEINRKDEMGTLLGALDHMQQSLIQTVSQVRSATDSINTSSEIANQDLSARTEQAASNLEETAASMEELTSTVSQSADAARQANQLAVSASEVAVRGLPHHGRNQPQQQEDQRHHWRHRWHCIPDQHPCPERSGRSRAGGRSKGAALPWWPAKGRLAQRSAEAAKEMRSSDRHQRRQGGRRQARWPKPARTISDRGLVAARERHHRRDHRTLRASSAMASHE